jgi:uncharacterized protein
VPIFANALPFSRLRRAMKSRFSLGPGTLHGPAHWKRVETFGIVLAGMTGADLAVVRLFAVLHDVCRENDDDDPEHGLRAAQLAEELRGRDFELDDRRFAILKRALIHHASGQIESDVTIGTCWDADRLDLPRAGILPDPRYLSTRAAREQAMRHWALSVSPLQPLTFNPT